VNKSAIGALAGLVVVLAACSPSASPTDGSEAPSSAPSEPAASGAASEAPSGSALTIVETSAGETLAGEGGLTLYTNADEADGSIACTDACVANWPPLEAPVDAGDANADLLGTVTRPDGIEQVTYNGFPLYYFAGDSAEGDIAGQGLGGVWFIANPSGEH
jgi:predicted lipoprotein with Yx(FWY)xxD motif